VLAQSCTLFGGMHRELSGCYVFNFKL